LPIASINASRAFDRAIFAAPDWLLRRNSIDDMLNMPIANKAMRNSNATLMMSVKPLRCPGYRILCMNTIFDGSFIAYTMPIFKDKFPFQHELP
jgi:hypothetical protein